MSTTRIQSGLSPVTTIEVEQTRARTAARIERPTFGSVMRTSADVVLRGVEVGATVVAGPIAGAAIRTARAGLGAGPLGGSVAAAAGGADGGEQSTIDQMRALQEQSQSFNMQYMALQEEVQQENRRFTTLSNVLKAKHETAKSAIGNIRS